MARSSPRARYSTSRELVVYILKNEVRAANSASALLLRHVLYTFLQLGYGCTRRSAPLAYICTSIADTCVVGVRRSTHSRTSRMNGQSSIVALPAVQHKLGCMHPAQSLDSEGDEMKKGRASRPDSSLRALDCWSAVVKRGIGIRSGPN